MTIAPPAPGRLGVAIPAPQVLQYLQQMEAWTSERREQLDALDATIRALPVPTAQQPGPNPRLLTNDVMLCLALWQSVRTRLDQLVATWDSGRVGQAELEKISVLVWGRLETSAAGAGQSSGMAGMNLSLPEACRLSDAMTNQLSTKLGMAPDVDALASRVRDLKRAMERLRDQVALEDAATLPASQRKLAGLESRLSTVEGKLARGGDIGGLIGPLEIEAATFERDMIVAGARRRTLTQKVDAVTKAMTTAREREKAVAEIAERAATTVTPAPKYAVPHVDALGPVPTDEAALDELAARLPRVMKAFDVVEHACADALTEHDELVARLADARARAAAVGLSDPAMEEVAHTAGGLLETRPAPVAVARSLVEAYTNHVALAASKESR